MLEDAPILDNAVVQGDYRRLRLRAPRICPQVRPGQFVHLRITERDDHVLRRPFSVCDVADDGILTIVYKVVGGGTELLARTPPGATCSLLGPLGHPFTPPAPGEAAVIVAGGYGSAATWLLARRAPTPPLLLLGARSAGDLLLADDFRRHGCEVRTATEDGTAGHRGRVTDLLAEVLARPPARLRVYGCGPHGMILAVARMLGQHGLDGELSLDHRMCCGVGACFACVVKVRDQAAPDGWRYARTCLEGPVFPAGLILADDAPLPPR